MHKQSALEEQLRQDEALVLKNNRFGMWIFQISWIFAFLCMIMVNWQMRFSRNWKPEGTQEVNALVGLFATGILCVSTFLVWRSMKDIRQDNLSAFLPQWLGAIGLALLFVIVMFYEWVTITQPSTQYAQVFRLMTGFHMVHALVIGAYMMMVYRNGRRGAYTADHHWAVEAGAKLWYFVLVAWLLFYIVIYWV
jgi:heme/copper-type cytochrome/quinol oxidase subunit 3